MAVSEMLETKIGQLYVGLIGRAPDRDGLEFWAQGYNRDVDNGRSADAALREVAQRMFDSNGAQDYYPDGLNDQQIVEQFYENVLGRQGDAEGIAFWTDALAKSGTETGDVLVSMIDAVTGYSGNDPAGVKSQQLFENKAAIADYYVDNVSQAGNAADIAGSTALLDAVTEDTDTRSESALSSFVSMHYKNDEVAFPNASTVVDISNGWELSALVSEVDQTTSLYLQKEVGTVDGLTARVGFEALTFEEGSRSGFEAFPQDDVLPPLFSAIYSGAGGSYSVDSGSSAIRIDGYDRREFFGLNDETLENNQSNFENGNERQLSVFDSPDDYDGLLDELLNGDVMFTKVVPANPYFPTIEGQLELDGFTDMLQLFDNLSVRREDNIYGESENNITQVDAINNSEFMPEIEFF